MSFDSVGLLFKNVNVAIGQVKPIEGTGGYGGIIVDATISETHSSSTDITKNAVEEGAKITDHAQLNPQSFTMEGVISDTPFGIPFVQNFQNAVNTVAVIFGKTSKQIDAYNKFKELESKREPFTVVTGLRQYQNMILTKFDVDRNVDKAGGLFFKATMEEIRIVKSQSSSLGGGEKNVKKDVKNISSKTKDTGGKKTDPVPDKSPVSDKPSGGTSEGKSNPLFDIVEGVKGIFKK